MCYHVHSNTACQPSHLNELPYTHNTRAGAISQQASRKPHVQRPCTYNGRPNLGFFHLAAL